MQRVHELINDYLLPKLIALHDASPQVMWTRQLLAELGHNQTAPAVVFQDNKSTCLVVSELGQQLSGPHYLRGRVVKRNELPPINLEHAGVTLSGFLLIECHEVDYVV